MSPPRRRKTPSRPAPRRRPAPARDFWGTEPVEPDEIAPIGSVDHPTALVESLGAPPFPGGEVARHYFDVVYERAAALAIALAASAGLSDTTEPD